MNTTPADTTARPSLVRLAELVAILDTHDPLSAAAVLGDPAPDHGLARAYLLGRLREAARTALEDLGVTA